MRDDVVYVLDSNYQEDIAHYIDMASKDKMVVVMKDGEAVLILGTGAPKVLTPEEGATLKRELEEFWAELEAGDGGGENDW